MIPAPTMTTVFQFFRNDPQPLTLEQITANFKDAGLAEVYLRSLVSDGLILKDEKGYRMSAATIEAGIADAEERIRGWQKRLEHLKSLKTS